MNTYTYATVIVPVASQASMQSLMGVPVLDANGVSTGMTPDVTTFITPLSAAGLAPATFVMSSGPFLNGQLNQVVTVLADALKADPGFVGSLTFGDDWPSAAHAMGLSLINASF